LIEYLEKGTPISEDKKWQLDRFRYYPRDAVTTLSADIHNARSSRDSRESLKAIVDYMRKHSLKTVKELAENFSERLKKEQSVEGKKKVSQ
jgi:hypothetical protein